MAVVLERLGEISAAIEVPAIPELQDRPRALAEAAARNQTAYYVTKEAISVALEYADKGPSMTTAQWRKRFWKAMGGLK